MQTMLRAMASTSLRQMVSVALKSRALAVPAKLQMEVASPLLSSSVAQQQPWWRQACKPIWSSTVQQIIAPQNAAILAGLNKSNMFARTICTTRETEAAAAVSAAISSVHTLEADEDAPPATLKTKKLTKSVKHIMELLDKEAVEAANKVKVIPNIKPGNVVQLKVEVPENKRRVSVLRGIVIARRNAGSHTTFRIRRMIAGVGVEMVFPLYSPNIKEIKILDKRRVRRAKLYYLRDKIARLSSC
ncbi:unnamed protein product [Sphagnum troendelagicum]|uniref:50S ribosomal protein L19, chloroplastic n=1 Tax=Sphagnum jensenii TaxID=128206 RepID=A0ABP0WQ55_9BRYO